MKTKSYLFLPLFHFWLNVGLNHSCCLPCRDELGRKPGRGSYPVGPSLYTLPPAALTTAPHRGFCFAVKRWLFTSKALRRGNAAICEGFLRVSPALPLPPRGLLSLEVRIPASLQSGFALPERGLFSDCSPNPYFLPKLDSSHGCTSMCRTKRNPGSQSTGQLAQTQKK